MRPLSLALLLAISAHAAAQDSPPPSSASEVEEIVVSITKRSESLQDVAASVTAFSEETLALANLESASDLVTLIPNVVTKGESRTGNFSICLFTSLSL